MDYRRLYCVIVESLLGCNFHPLIMFQSVYYFIIFKWNGVEPSPLFHFSFLSKIFQQWFNTPYLETQNLQWNDSFTVVLIYLLVQFEPFFFFFKFPQTEKETNFCKWKWKLRMLNKKNDIFQWKLLFVPCLFDLKCFIAKRIFVSMCKCFSKILLVFYFYFFK